jgi:HEAT repeat protein
VITYYCPKCWQAVSELDETCPACAYHLDLFQEIPYEEKLLSALQHPVPERRIMAAQILGALHSSRALEAFQAVLADGSADYYLLRAVLLAAAQIEHPLRTSLLQKAQGHASHLVAQLAEELLEKMPAGPATTPNNSREQDGTDR